MTSDRDRNSSDRSSGGESKRGFASMDEDKQREIASQGGKAAHEKGTAHEFTSEEAREAGRKGGQAAHEKGTAHEFDSEEAREAGRKGGHAAHEKGTAHEFSSQEAREAGKKGEDEGKGELAARICKELTVHSQLEEEIFYPAVREAIDDDDLMNEAVVEHASAKDLITQIQSMKVSDPMYDAVVSVLGEYVNHHIEEEQNEMFPKAQKAKMDLEEIGMEISQRKEELMEE